MPIHHLSKEFQFAPYGVPLFSHRLRVVDPLPVHTHDHAELISRYCRLYGGACYPAEILRGNKSGAGKFVFAVQFRKPDGELLVTGDTLFIETLEDEFPFRVELIGTRYFVLDLPPRTDYQ